jgi:hypothetical protein
MNAQCLIADCGLRIADSLTADRDLPYCEPPFNPQSRAAEAGGARRLKPVINVTKTITTARASLLFFITSLEVAFEI